MHFKNAAVLICFSPSAPIKQIHEHVYGKGKGFGRTAGLETMPLQSGR